MNFKGPGDVPGSGVKPGLVNRDERRIPAGNRTRRETPAASNIRPGFATETYSA